MKRKHSCVAAAFVLSLLLLVGSVSPVLAGEGAGLPAESGVLPVGEEKEKEEEKPFYGIWCEASMDLLGMQAAADELCKKGYDARVIFTSDWSALNPEPWYALTAGVCTTGSEAVSILKEVKGMYPGAYIKYTGIYQRVEAAPEETAAAAPAAVTPAAPVAAPEAVTPVPTVPAPFYGIWCQATKDPAEAEAYAEQMRNQGLDGMMFVTTDWSNLNPVTWYVVSAGAYGTEDEAYSHLAAVQAVYGDAYVKYSGDYIGEAVTVPAGPAEAPAAAAPAATDPLSAAAPAELTPPPAPFYGIWCEAAKDQAEAESYAEEWKKNGFDASVIITTEWGNLNPEKWYVVTVGQYGAIEDAKKALPEVQKSYPDAYVKYTGESQGSRRVQYTVYSKEHILKYGNCFVFSTIVNPSGSNSMLVLDENTVFDEEWSMKSSGDWKEGETPIDWCSRQYDQYLEDNTFDIMGLMGVFEADLTGNHIDRIYGAYWWD